MLITYLTRSGFTEREKCESSSDESLHKVTGHKGICREFLNPNKIDREVPEIGNRNSKYERGK